MREKWPVRDDGDVRAVYDRLRELVRSNKFVEVRIEAGQRRSVDQNALAWELYRKAALIRADRDVNEIHREAKLNIGVPILCRDNDDFRESWERTTRDLSYEEKLAACGEWLAVTRFMTTRQFKEYIDEFAVQYGVPLPNEEAE